MRSLRPVPWWGVLSSVLAPVLLVGGWMLAGARQPAGFDATVETISALASYGAADRWVMTLALLGVGICHLATALALRPAAAAGRVLLGIGGIATVMVAATPLPVRGDSVLHTLAAGVAFLALAAWPAMSWRPYRTTVSWSSRRAGLSWSTHRPAWALRRGVSLTVAAMLLALVGLFAVELVAGGPRVGLTERVAAGAEAAWPFLVVISARATR